MTVSGLIVRALVVRLVVVVLDMLLLVDPVVEVAISLMALAE